MSLFKDMMEEMNMQYRIVLTEKIEVGYQIRNSSKEKWQGKTIFSNVGKNCPSISFDAFEQMKHFEISGFEYQGIVTMQSDALWASL